MRRDPVPVLGRLADRLVVPLLKHCVVLPRAPLPGVEGCWAGEAAAHTAESLLPAASGGVFVHAVAVGAYTARRTPGARASRAFGLSEARIRRALQG